MQPFLSFLRHYGNQKNEKMKNIVYFIVVISLLSHCKSTVNDNINPNLTQSNISKIITDGQLENEFLYNNIGQLIEYRTYFDDGKSIWESTRYNWNDGVVSKIEFWTSFSLTSSASPKPGNPLRLESYQTQEHDAQKRVIKTINYLAGYTEPRTYSTTSYDNKGRKIEIKTFTPDGKLSNISKNFIYDNNNNLLLWETSHWEYNNNPSPFRNLPVYKDASWISPFNVSSNFGRDNAGNKINIWNYEYTYDPVTRFPKTMKSFFGTKLLHSSEFIY